MHAYAGDLCTLNTNFTMHKLNTAVLCLCQKFFCVRSHDTGVLKIVFKFRISLTQQITYNTQYCVRTICTRMHKQ